MNIKNNKIKNIQKRPFFSAYMKELRKSSVMIKQPVKTVRTYHVTLPIYREGKLSYITYDCKVDIEKSYLCNHSNMGIADTYVLQSRYWNAQECKVKVVLTSLQGFYKDKYHDNDIHKRQNTYAPLNHESMTSMFDPLVLKSFPTALYLQINNHYRPDVSGDSVNDVLTHATTHTILCGYIKDFRITLSHNPILFFTIYDCLQHSIDNHTSEYSAVEFLYRHGGSLFKKGDTKQILAKI